VPSTTPAATSDKGIWVERACWRMRRNAAPMSRPCVYARTPFACSITIRVSTARSNWSRTTTSAPAPSEITHGLVVLMTMTPGSDRDADAQARLTIVNIRGDGVEIGDLIESRVELETQWDGPSSDRIYGLRGEQGDAFAAATLIPETFEVTMTSSEGAPVELVTLVRSTFLRYLAACVKIGQFALEGVPLQTRDGEVEHESLRLALAARGATWLSTLPSKTFSRDRVPRRDELTVIEPPITPSQSRAPDDPSGAD
jgi:hypothetical protein